jgi:acyl carrier protein
MKEKIVKILNEIRPEFDFETIQNYFENGMLDSFDVITLVTTLDETFSISIEGVDILPDNFNDLNKIIDLLQKYGVNHES